jgi:hypothetical protein
LETSRLEFSAARAHEILKDLRREDSIEMMCFADPREALDAALANSSVVFSGFLGDRIGLVGGLRESSITRPSAIWMLTTPVVEQRRIALARGSEDLIGYFLSNYGPLCGYCLASNKRSKRWLEWLGFELQGPFDLPVVGLGYYFERIA